MSPKALITVEIRIKRAIIANPDKDKQPDADQGPKDKKPKGVSSKLFTFEIQTVPPLEDVWTDFNSMVDLFLNSVSRIKRIDDLVIP